MHNLICSTPVNWTALIAHLNQFGQEIAVVKGDGYCFLSSVTKALARDCGKIVQHESLGNEVLDHMYEDCKYYASFHEDGSAWAMLKQAEFLLGGKYILNITKIGRQSGHYPTMISYRKSNKRFVSTLQSQAQWNRS